MEMAPVNENGKPNGRDTKANPSRMSSTSRAIDGQSTAKRESTSNIISQRLSACCCGGAVFWLYMIFLVVFGIITLSICISAGAQISQMKDSGAYLYGMESLSLWKERFILDIRVTQSGECPLGYEEALNYEWPGSIQGCACIVQEGPNEQIFVVKGQCNTELLSFACVDVGALNSQFMRHWKNGQRICLKRDASNSFFTQPTSCATSAGSLQTRMCGQGQTAVCRQANEDCPILEIDSTVTFSFETKSAHYPVSSFRMDEYSHCDHSSKQQISKEKRGDYVLLNRLRTFCTQNDPRPIKLDSIGEETLFQQNEVLWNLLMVSKQLPAYPRLSNAYTWVLSSMPYPAWTMSCRNNESYSMPVVEDRFKLSSESYNQIHLIVTTSISLFVVSLVLVIIEVRRKFIRNTDVKYYKDERFYDPRFMNNRFGRVLYPRERGWVRTTYIITGVHWAFRILNIPSIFISFLRVDDSIGWFSETVTSACSDEFYVNNIATDYKNRLNQLRDFYAVMLGFWWALFVIDILYFAFRYFYEILPAQEEEFLTDLIVKGGDKQEVIPIIHRSKAQAGALQNAGSGGQFIGHTLQQSAIIEEEGFDEDQLYEDEKKR